MCQVTEKVKKASNLQPCPHIKQKTGGNSNQEVKKGCCYPLAQAIYLGTQPDMGREPTQASPTLPQLGSTDLGHGRFLKLLVQGEEVVPESCLHF